ncbi:PqqD family peptide modification chaperone [Pseudonocardia sp. ICBG1142]|uniref:PqqD family peptide modification chaperone n=1 Tax=Pseudonocardia sp. ICBG1142 TaxID=2846760 RepID=UPI001CF66790
MTPAPASFQLAEHITINSTDGGAVLLDKRNGEYWALNETATYMLNGLTAQLDDFAIATSTSELFEAPIEAIELDVKRLRSTLSENGFTKSP